jgi:short-subunit dehydrogenase
MQRKSDTYAVITGASGGLGGAFALQAARMGWNLILVDLPDTGLADVGRRLNRSYAVDAQCFELDLSDQRDREKLRDRICDRFLNIDLLVNNAGTGCQASFEEAPIARLASTVEVNIKATMHLTYLLLPELRRQRRSTIINVASLAAFYPMPAMAVYAATKSFILNFSLALREELAGTAVRVGALCPAGMVTNRETADQVAAQGFFGRVTTWEPERVAAVAIKQALRGRAVIIPGAANKLLRWAGQVAPRWLVVRLIGGRWRKAETVLGEQGSRPRPVPQTTWG